MVSILKNLLVNLDDCVVVCTSAGTRVLTRKQLCIQLLVKFYLWHWQCSLLMLAMTFECSLKTLSHRMCEVTFHVGHEISN